MSFPTEKRSIFAKDLQKSVAAVQHINDPTTSADEMLTASKFILYLLLAYSGILGAVSYYKNFAPSFGHEYALFMCVCLAFAIEFGKSYFGVWAVRLLLIAGIREATSEMHQFIKLVALIAFALATFAMSVINSTRGGEQLSHLLRQEKTGLQMFQANTAAIDQQIEAVNNQIAANNGNTWKGIVSYESQKANKKLSGSLENLQKQKTQTIEQQRADWQVHQAQQTENGNFAARLVMASGGWVELLQFILLLLRVSCEKSLLPLVPQPSPAPPPASNKTPGFNGSPSAPYQSNGTAANFQNHSNGIGFNYSNRDQPAAAAPGVSQSVTGVTQFNSANPDKPSAAAFGHFKTAFQREVFNLKTGNGARHTVCSRLGAALAGMIYNVSTIDEETRLSVLEYLVNFIQEVHSPILNSYTVELAQTPLAHYKPQFDELYRLISRVGVAAA